jgi:transposase
LYGITSERKLVEELRMHLAWRWFTGLGFPTTNFSATLARSHFRKSCH